MDRRIEENLEGHLHGSLDTRGRAEMDEALRQDEESRRMVELFEKHARMMRTLRAPSELDPAPGFYARVMERIEAQRPASIWNLFVEPRFFQRLAFASAALLVLMGVLLVAPADEEASLFAAQPAAVEHVLAQDGCNGPGCSDPTSVMASRQLESHREAVLVTLTTHGE